MTSFEVHRTRWVVSLRTDLPRSLPDPSTSFPRPRLGGPVTRVSVWTGRRRVKEGRHDSGVKELSGSGERRGSPKGTQEPGRLSRVGTSTGTPEMVHTDRVRREGMRSRDLGLPYPPGSRFPHYPKGVSVDLTHSQKSHLSVGRKFSKPVKEYFL